MILPKTPGSLCDGHEPRGAVQRGTQFEHLLPRLAPLALARLIPLFDTAWG